LAKLLLKICLVTLLTACGAKGDLYLDNSGQPGQKDNQSPTSNPQDKEPEVSKNVPPKDPLLSRERF
jgi:predicted small lipoprotein YifL